MGKGRKEESRNKLKAKQVTRLVIKLRRQAKRKKVDWDKKISNQHSDEDGPTGQHITRQPVTEARIGLEIEDYKKKNICRLSQIFLIL